LYTKHEVNKMIPVEASQLVPGKRYYIRRKVPYPRQCNKFRGRFTENIIVGEYITSCFNELLSVTSSLAHTHSYPRLSVHYQDYHYYECSQDSVEKAREERKNAAIFNEQFNEQLRTITGDPYFHVAKIPYTQVTKINLKYFFCIYAFIFFHTRFHTSKASFIDF